MSFATSIEADPAPVASLVAAGKLPLIRTGSNFIVGFCSGAGQIHADRVSGLYASIEVAGR